MSFQKGCDSYEVDNNGILTVRFPKHWGRPDATFNLNDCIGMNSNTWGPYLEWNSSGFVSQMSKIQIFKADWQVQMECTLKDGGFLPTSKFASIDIGQWIAIKEYKLVFLKDEYLAHNVKMQQEQEERAKQPVSFWTGVKEGASQGGVIGGVVGGIMTWF